MFDKSVLASHKINTYPLQTSQLILCRKIINVYLRTQTQHINTIHEQNTDSFGVNHVTRIATNQV